MLNKQPSYLELTLNGGVRAIQCNGSTDYAGGPQPVALIDTNMNRPGVSGGFLA